MFVPATSAVLEIAIAALAFTSASTITPDAIATTPALVIVASPDKAAAVNPVPSPIRICVLVTAFAERTPELFASLTITVLAAALAIFASVTLASVILAVTIASLAI